MLATYHHIIFHPQMVADDAAAGQLLEEDRQGDAILKEFFKGTPVPLLPDSDSNHLVMQNMMSPGPWVTRSFVAKGKKKRKWCL
jgi:hypothetical protein